MPLPCTLYTPRDRRNYQRFTWWMTASMFLFAAATILLGRSYLAPGPAAWTLSVASILLMVGAVRSYILFLRTADELLRKIHLESLALAFGVGVVAMMGYRLFERLGAPKLDINDPFLVMIAVWAVAQWLGARRYAAGEAS